MEKIGMDATCTIGAWASLYDPARGDSDSGIELTELGDIHDDWQWPFRFVGKENFEPIGA